MGVYQRTDSRFWWMALESSGERRSTGIPVGPRHARADSRRDADEIYRAAMGDLARGVHKVKRRRSQQRTFRQQAEWYQKTVAIHRRGKYQEKSAIGVLIRAFGDTPLDQLTTAQIDQWKFDRAAVVKPATVNREIEILKPLLARAVPEFLDTNPATPVKKFKLRHPPIAILTTEAEDAILAAATPGEKAFILLGLDALLRCGDARRLKTDYDHGTHLSIVDPKTEPYKVPISTRLRAALDALQPRDGFYFPRKYKGKWAAMNPNTAFLLFRQACARANVPAGRAAGGITYHGLRHTGATRAAKVVKLRVLQQLGGWKNLTQLVRYDHPDDPEMIRAVEAIGSRPVHGPSAVAENVRKNG